MRILKQDSLTAHVPVIALSASARPADIERGLQIGFDDYLTKPLDVDRLANVFNRLFGSP